MNRVLSRSSESVVGSNARRTLVSLQTPIALLDYDKVRANCGRMLGHVRALGSRLRPHMKSLKSADAARLAIDPRHGGIAVATLNEARYFVERGFSDVCCAVCLAPDKLTLVACLRETGAQLSFFVDSMELAQAVVNYKAPFAVWIEVDSGEHRTGLAPDNPDLLKIAGLLRAARGVEFMGVATHAGHSYACRSIKGVRSVAEQEGRAALEAADRLRYAGFEVPNVSVGSTPTTVHATFGAGITEFRAGVYMAGDLVQWTIGSVGVEDIACSVLATVVSRQRARRQIVLDAGGRALSKDRGSRDTGHDYGYGLVTDLAGSHAFGELIVAEVHQGRGEIYNVPSCDLPSQSLTIGEFQHVRTAVESGALVLTAIGDVLWCRAVGRQSDEEVTVFDSSGLALQDLFVCAALVAERQS